MKIGFPHFNHANAKSDKDFHLLGVFDKVVSLRCMCGAIRVRSGIAVPKCPIDFQGDILIRDVEIHTSPVGAIGQSKPMLGFCLDSQVCHDGTDGFLQFRYTTETPLGYGFGHRRRQFLLGFIRHGVSIFRFPFGVVITHGVRRGITGRLGYVVRGRDITPDQPSASTVIVASGRAEHPTSFRFHMRWWSNYLDTTSGTKFRRGCRQFLSTELVRAFAGTGGLSPVF